MTALDAILASVAKGGKVVSIVPVDGEERAALESELAGVCDQQSPVSRNGDQRFIGVDPDGADWTVALLAVPRKPVSLTLADSYELYCDAVNALARTKQTNELTAVLVAHLMVRDEL